MDSAHAYWELVPAASGLVVSVCFVIWIVRRVTAPKRIPVPKHWMHLEQLRFSNPGDLPRAMAVLLLSIVLVGGLIVGPFALGVAPDISWYVREDWIAALFVSVCLSAVAHYYLRPKRPRCPSCKSTALEKDISLPPARPIVRVYLCRSCQVVWQTTYNFYTDGGRRRGVGRPNF